MSPSLEPPPPRPIPTRRSPILWVIAGMVLLGLVVAAGIAAASVRGSMRVRALTPPALAAIQIGSPVEIMVELTETPSNGPSSAILLEQTGENTYRRTTWTLRVAREASSPIIMGKPSDIRPGAILDVRGRRTEEDVVTADRVVVLNRYVTVE